MGKSARNRLGFLFVIVTLLLVISTKLAFFNRRRDHVRENSPDRIYVSTAALNKPTLVNGTFVFITTFPQNHWDRVPVINSTYLHRLEHAEFFTSGRMWDERVPYRTVFQDFDDSYGTLFHKSLFSFYYAYRFVSAGFCWYVKVDDDTYVVAENLQRFLDGLDCDTPLYAGFRLKNAALEHGYNSGSIYVLSRAAVRVLVEDLYKNDQLCPFDQYEDVGIGRCLASKKIYPIPTRDSGDRGRFHLFEPYKTYMHDDNVVDFPNYYMDSHYPGFAEFSEHTISVHHVTPADMVMADLFLYRIRVR